MALEQSGQEPNPTLPEITVEDYAAFIGQIELIAIWLRESQIINHYGHSTPQNAEVTVTGEARWEPYAEAYTGFQAFDSYKVLIGPPSAPDAEIRATFGVRFLSPRPMTGPLF